MSDVAVVGQTFFGLILQTFLEMGDVAVLRDSKWVMKCINILQ